MATSTSSSSPNNNNNNNVGGLFCLTAAAVKSLAVALLYGFSSLALGLVNKIVLSQYNFDGYFFLLAAQLCLSLSICVISRDYLGDPFKVPVYDKALHQASARMGVMYVANVATGLIGLQLVNIPMFFCLRRLVPPVTIAYEYFLLGIVHPQGVRVAVGLIVTGTIIAGWDTLSTDVIGYAFTMLNNFCTAATSIMQKQFSDSTKLSTFGGLYYNALTAAPLALFLSLLTGEVNAIFTEFEYVNDSSFWFWFLVTCAFGPLLTYSSMLSSTYNSPLATSITGNIKDIASTIIGAVFFPGFVATAKSVGGLFISFSGAGTYVYVKLKGMSSTAAAAASSSTSASATPSVESSSSIEDVNNNASTNGGNYNNTVNIKSAAAGGDSENSNSSSNMESSIQGRISPKALGSDHSSISSGSDSGKVFARQSQVVSSSSSSNGVGVESSSSTSLGVSSPSSSKGWVEGTTTTASQHSSTTEVPIAGGSMNADGSEVDADEDNVPLLPAPGRGMITRASRQR